MKIYYKVLLATLPLIILPALFIGSISLYLFRQEVHENALMLLREKLAGAIIICQEQQIALQQEDSAGSRARVQEAQATAATALLHLSRENIGYIYVIDTTGAILIHPAESLRDSSVRDAEWFRQMSGAERSTLAYVWQGEPHLAVYTYFPTWGWYIVATAPERELYNPMRGFSTYSLISILCTALIPVLLLAFLARWITTPVLTLVDRAVRLGQGEFDTQVAINSHDEIGQLARALDQMAYNLRASRAEMAQQAQNLLQARETEWQMRQTAEILREIGELVSSTLDSNEVLERILTTMGRIVAYDRANVMLLVGDRLIVQAARGYQTPAVVQALQIRLADVPTLRRVITTGQPQIVRDTEQDADWRPDLSTEKAPIRSWLGLPLTVGNEVFGVLNINSQFPYKYSERDLSLMTAFANQVAIAVRNAQLYAEVQDRARRLALLHELSMAINSTLDLDIILIAACRELVTNFRADHSAMLLFNDSCTYGKVVAEAPAQDAGGIRISLKDYAAAQRVIATGQPLAIYDAQHSTLTTKVWELMCEQGIQSTLLVPLIVKDRVIGAFTLDACTAPRHFEAVEIALCQTIAAQLATAIENARWAERERERVDQELEMARQIQTNLLPAAPPQLPGLDIAAFSQPARQAGGDFYNYFHFAEGCIGITIGDVSGKGMQAALLMALSFGVLTTEIHREIAPAALLESLNLELYPHAQRNNMNTALGYVILEELEEVWALHAANAGLVAPLLRHRDSAVEWVDVFGLPLGMTDDANYRELRLLLTPGEVLVLSSDGVVETMNEAEEMYGFERLEQCLATAPRPGGARQILEHILADVHAFEGRAEAHDDLTLIVVVIEE